LNTQLQLLTSSVADDTTDKKLRSRRHHIGPAFAKKQRVTIYFTFLSLWIFSRGISDRPRVHALTTKAHPHATCANVPQNSRLGRDRLYQVNTSPILVSKVDTATRTSVSNTTASNSLPSRLSAPITLCTISIYNVCSLCISTPGGAPTKALH
jgi:hypothetical protein